MPIHSEEKERMSHGTQNHDDAGSHPAETLVEDMDHGWRPWAFAALVCLVFALLIYALRQYAVTAI